MNDHIINPFQFGTIVSGRNFCNRQKEIAWLKSNIMDGFSVWLYSPRRFGKSSLIHKVYNDIEKVDTIYFDLYNVKSLDDFSKKYAALIASRLFNWKYEIKKLTSKLSGYFNNLQPSISFDEFGTPTFSLQISEIKSQIDVETIMNSPEKIAKDSGKKICIAFDEFQEINRIDPFLINWMRSAFQNHENVSYIFSGSQQSLMELIFTSQQSPFYEFASKMKIEPIDFKELKQFIADKFKSKGLLISESNIDMILEKSEGHPHFTQYFASVVFNLIRDGANQEDEFFTQLWINKIIQSQSIIFQGLYDQLTNIQRVVLTTIAKLTDVQELFSSKLQSQYGLPSSSTLATALDSLIKKSLIAKERKRYKVLNPVMKEWLLTLD